MYKVAIIGCGMIANSAHIPAYKHLPEDFEVVSVFDVNPEAAKETANRHNIPSFYADAEKMLKEQSPDVVSVCAPNCLHSRYAKLALENGCHVMCEKPAAINEKEAKEMFALAKEKNLLLMACQSMRFTPDRLAAKKLADSGRLGDVYFGEFARIRRRGIPSWGSFHIKELSGGGAFMDIGVHMVDAILWIMGNPEIAAVHATSSKKHYNELGTLKSSGALTGNVDIKREFNPDEMDVESFASGSVSLKNGGRINFKVAWAANLPDETTITLVGDGATISLPEGKIYCGIDGEETLQTEASKYPDEPFGGHFYLVDNLLGVLKGEQEPFVKPEETINVARVLEGFYKSAATGKEVIFDD